MEIEKIININDYRDKEFLKNNSKIYLDGIDKGFSLKSHEEVKLYMEGLRIGLALSESRNYNR